ncbi:hypothetical protein FFWV33_19035 [Flavobacterium faecale]|uniref:Uncharacterized protein n=1 Tax=Flavobacterium faecale TaxID=1355330 RepID=A0A2S1LIW9_9FLAO|nr:hypothetical protein [Flavobacterium faecale]AWG23722.1 hypothetical protein FFWV33_19035 [Flavobacterium faecale]
MSRMIYDYTKGMLERASLDPIRFSKELRKAANILLPYEIEHLRNWLLYFTSEKPMLKKCLTIVNK